MTAYEVAHWIGVVACAGVWVVILLGIRAGWKLTRETPPPWPPPPPPHPMCRCTINVDADKLAAAIRRVPRGPRL